MLRRKMWKEKRREVGRRPRILNYQSVRLNIPGQRGKSYSCYSKVKGLKDCEKEFRTQTL